MTEMVEKFRLPQIMGPNPKTAASIVSDYLNDFPWGAGSGAERQYSDDREFLPVLLGCIGRVFSAQTQVGLKCAVGDVIGAIGFRLAYGTEAYDNSMSAVRRAALLKAGAASGSYSFGWTSSEIASRLSSDLRAHLSTYTAIVVKVASGEPDPTPKEPRTDEPLMRMLARCIYLLALLEDLYPTNWDTSLGGSPLTDDDLVEVQDD